MGTRVAVMQQGVLQQVGPPQEVYDRPASLFVAQFIGTPPMNVFPPGTLEPGDVLVGVRPEHITLDREGPLTARVAAGRGPRLRAAHHLRRCPTRPAVVARTSDVDGPREGEAVFIDAEPRHRHHFDPVTGKRQDDREVSRTRTREALLAFVVPAARPRDPRRVRLLPARPHRSGSACTGAAASAATKTYVGWHQYGDVFQSNEFRHSLGVTFVFALITVPSARARPRPGRAGRQAPAGHAVLPHRLLLDGGHLGRRGLADVARAAPAPDRRAHQHPALRAS